MTLPTPQPLLPRLLVNALILGTLLLSAIPLPAAPLQRAHSRLYVDFSSQPTAANLLAHDIAFLDAEAEAELGPGRTLGHLYYAQLKTVRVAPDSLAGKRALESGLPVKTKAAELEDLLVDVLHPSWLTWVVEQQAKTAAQRGFSGFLIDGIAALSELDAQHPDRFLPHRQAIITLVTTLRREFPDKPVVLRGGFEFIHVLKGQIEGLLVENALTQDDAEVRIRKAQINGLKIYAVEHGTPADSPANQAAADRLARLGCLPFISTPKLDGTVLGPLLPQSRHLLVLHGWDAEKEARPAQLASTTWTAQTLAPALTWLDLAPRYVGVSEWLGSAEKTTPLLHPRPAGIVIDPSLILHPTHQAAAAAWLAQARANGIPILLAGQPFTEPAAWSTLATALELSGDGQPTAASTRSSLTHYTATWFRTGQLPNTRALRPLHLQSPDSASHLLSYRLTGTGTQGSPTFDACFLAAWGGAWLDAANRAPIDVIPFLEAALQREAAGPVPDTTTLAGHRVFLSTVQGRGFCAPAWKAGSPFCGQLLQAELEKFPGLPATIAVAEADIRGLSPDATPSDTMRYEATARALFSLPHVEPAANSFSRPTDWSPDTFQPGPLRPLVSDPRTGIDREITGALAYLKRRLVPPGKFLRFFLWPEGAAPSQAALDHLAQTGAAHLPGSWQSGWSVAPASESPIETTPHHRPDTADSIAATWFQTHAATGTRRLSPIHLAYAFADLQKPATLDALRQIWTWCAAQPLHPMTASTYAAFARDAAQTQVFPLAENHWLITTSGRPATLRLPASRGLPDLARSSGVTGYSTHQGQTYIHLGGQVLSQLVLRSATDATPHLHLVQADRLLDFYELRPQSARFRTQGRDNAIVTLGGLHPGTWYQIDAAGHQTRLQADPTGRLTLKAPALATVAIQTTPELGKPYASR